MNSAPAESILPHMEDSRWLPYPEATELLVQRVDLLRAASPFLQTLSRRMAVETGTRLFDWVDTVHCESAEELLAAGFEPGSGPWGGRFRHPHALLPLVVVDTNAVIFIRVDSVVDALTAWGLDARSKIHGDINSSIRWVTASYDGGVEVRFIERHGDPADVRTTNATKVDLASWASWHERLRLRRREFNDDTEAFSALKQLVAEAAGQLGVDRACELFFDTERRYWTNRNDAAQIQKMRQDRLGLGWANHDHHTYRSSRQYFPDLIEVLETLGMECRERFYAGEQAGWGAQVLEQPAARIVVFADVDLGPEEILGDFAHHPLPSREQLGTVGLWAALHGEAILQAGMHHLECQFDFDAARTQLTDAGVPSMDPFTNFSYLRQAFTEGQRWSVREDRLRSAVAAGWITPKEAEGFRSNGVIGSHLEILERNDGYKGFNQTGVSDIIRRTDPRRQAS
jgi:hypothetical protein